MPAPLPGLETLVTKRPLLRLRMGASAVALVALHLLIALQCGPALGQMGGMGGGGMGGGGMGGGGMGGGGMGGGGMGGGGRGGSTAGGIVIDANGVLRTRIVADAGLSAERLKASVAALPADLQTKSPLRKVALSRLEAEVAKAAASGRGIPDELEKLAGLTRVQYVFIYPADGGAADSSPGEVVIAGPAEPWATDATGRVVGTASGTPTVLLEDLATALRAFPPGQPTDHGIGCSIDPTQEGLAAMQAFLRKLGRVNPKASTNDIVNGMRESLGAQRIRVDGVSPASHFAQVMVEADYRMKLIGIGLERPPVKMNSWVELTSAGGVAANALQRWYFMPDYKCIRVSEDDLAIELVGRGVKLVGADEAVLPDGRRMTADRADRASKTFTDTFTRKYPEIAARHPVYAQLRTLIDLAVLAAYLQEHDAYGRTLWDAAALRDEQICKVERFQPPVVVEPAINAVWRGSRLLTPIGGGVSLQPRIALDSPNLLMDEQGTVAKARGDRLGVPAGRWWWD
jgi:hypothetical protein